MTETHAAVTAAGQVQEGVGATGAGISVSVLVVVLLAWWLHRAIERKRLKPMHIAGAFVAGALLSGSLIGGIATQTANSVGTGVASMLGNFTTGSGSGSAGSSSGR